MISLMRVATVELDVRTADVDGNLAAARAGVERAAAHGASLVALPEMWPTSFVPMPRAEVFEESDRAVEAIVALTETHDVTVVGSAYQVVDDPRLPRNRAHVLADGEVRASYDKVHLFSPTAEHVAFSAGSLPPPVVTLRGTDAKVSPIVCYDLRFPAVARAAFRGGAEILVVVAQWPDARASHWRALAQGRAAESEAFVVACNRVGTDEIGRRKMRLTFSGDAGVYAPSGALVEPVATEEIPAPDGRVATRVTVCEIDLAEVRALRRAVPVAADERLDVVRRWLSS
ncbi:MAG: nitrilase-related carbon-nitrogen hydrolase [Planctomycetota bacterium]